MRTGFYVSGNASRLLKLFEKQSLILKNVKLVFIDNESNSTLKEECIKNKINFIEINGTNPKYNISNVLLEHLEYNDINYCYCFGTSILKGDILNRYKNKIINFHPSLLPSFPGLNAIDQAIKAKATLIGNTSHFIDTGIDTGPIILQNSINYSSFNNYEDVLSLQIPMIEKINSLLLQERIYVDKNNKVQILNDTNDTFTK